MKLTAEHLRQARALIEDESRWCTQVSARDANGRQVTFYDPNAVRWCAAGAIAKSLPDADWWEVSRELLAFYGRASITGLFDANDRGHAAALAELDRLANLLEQQSEPDARGIEPLQASDGGDGLQTETAPVPVITRN